MKTLDNSRIEGDICLALGYFDCLHLGHRLVFDTLFKLCEKQNALPCCITFDLALKDGTPIYPFDERVQLLKALGIKNIIIIEKEDLGITPQVFLDKLFSTYSIVGLTCGNDFTFGKNATGNSDTISRYLKDNDINCTLLTCSQIMYDQEKLSTKAIKQILQKGDIDTANSLTITPYSIKGNVVSGFNIGSKLGFPTANVLPPTNKFLPKAGVYAGCCVVDGIEYKALLNLGERPTFDEYVYKVECHLLDFCGTLYNKEISIFPQRYLREIKKFENAEQLKKQISIDLQKVRCI